MNTVLRWKFDRVYVATDHPGFSISIHIQAAPLRNGTAKISAFRFRNRRFIEAPINTTVGTSSNPVQDVSAAVGRGTRPGYPVGKAKREQEEEAGAHGAMKALCVCEDSHRSDLPRTMKAGTLSCVFDPAQVYAGVSGQADTCTCACACAYVPCGDHAARAAAVAHAARHMCDRCGGARRARDVRPRCGHVHCYEQSHRVRAHTAGAGCGYAACEEGAGRWSSGAGCEGSRMRV